jgi:hypothetical protein
MHFVPEVGFADTEAVCFSTQTSAHLAIIAADFELLHRLCIGESDESSLLGLSFTASF